MVADWREDYNDRRPHSSPGMKAPRQLRARVRQSRVNGKGDYPRCSRAGPQTPQDAPIPDPEDRITPDSRPEGDQAALATSLRSPSVLTPRNGDPTTLQPETNPRLSQQVDR
jgi:Integrase core domain